MISVEHLTKCYGDFMAVSDLSLEIEEGHVYGFLGPNGAGKSTTMNIMTGCLSPTDGHVRIGGYDIFEEPLNAKKLIGYLPEQPPLYLTESPLEYLRFVGEAKGLKGEELRTQIDSVIGMTGIENVCMKQIGKLSKGYKQRVGIAQALLGNPKVIILDEPTVGLDPIQIIEIRDLIRELGREHTVIFSSHILSEVQTICDKVVIISHGKLVAVDDTDNLENRLAASNEITLRAEGSAEEVAEMLKACGEPEFKVINSENSITKFTVTVKDAEPDDMARSLFFAFAENKKAIFEMTAKKANLEEIFLELTQNEPENAADADGTPDADMEAQEDDAQAGDPDADMEAGTQPSQAADTDAEKEGEQ